MSSVDAIRVERERREAVARERAAKLPAGDYYADGWDVCEHGGRLVLQCESHWDACLVLLALGQAYE